MTEKRTMLAFDCSNSSIRTILGIYDGKKLNMETVLQVPNAMVRAGDTDWWDILAIYSSMVEGLAEAAAQVEKIDSVGICTWGVDFALFTEEGHMLSNPLAYRNPFGEEILNGCSREQKRELFYESGILCDKINSIYMLKAMQKRYPGIYGAARRLLMIPDILNYMLTGVMINEPSELSTTQLMNVSEGRISGDICRKAGIDAGLFGETGRHGEVIGKLLPSVAEQAGIDYEIPVICVPSHDTAAAVLGIPAAEKDFAFISSGTWSLIGSETDEVLVNEQVEAAGLTNELGAFGKITLLKNNMGMFIVQKLRDELGGDISWEDFYLLSDPYEGKNVPHFDVNDERFFNPDNMGKAVWDSFRRDGKVSADAAFDTGMVLRSFLESLAASYKESIEQIEKIRGKHFSRIYIAGGGNMNHRLNRLTAAYTGREVVTGSSESTSCGNFLAQIKHFEPDFETEELREIIGRSIETKIYS